MKILFTNRDHSTVSGGDSNKIQHYQLHLQKLGIQADYTPSVMYPKFEDYDIIHTFHLGHEFSYKFFLEANRIGKPLVISPILFPDQSNPQVYRDDMLKYASGIAFLSEGEQQETIKPHTDMMVISDIEEKAYIIPNGINPVFGTDGPKLRHPNCPGEEYVLCVGRIDQRKNQHKLAQACMELDIPLMLVGQPYDNVVVDQVQTLADIWNGLWWEPSQPAHKLVEAYRGAKVLACPSTLEMWPNVVAEGGLAGCNLVVGRGSMTFADWEGDVDGIYGCDNTIDSIKDAVNYAYSAKRRNIQEPFSQYTWDRAAEELKTMYKEVLNGGVN